MPSIEESSSLRIDLDEVVLDSLQRLAGRVAPSSSRSSRPVSAATGAASTGPATSPVTTPGAEPAPARPGSNLQEAAQRDAAAERGNEDRGGNEHRDQRREAHGREIVDQSEVVGKRILIVLPEQQYADRDPAPVSPTITPSIMNGQRMNQLVAPTSLITSTSRRRA